MDNQHLVYDCVVVGSGHAGSCAALAASEAGCKRLLIVEKAPQEWYGGNGYFTAGAFRTVHNGLADLAPIVQNLSQEQAANIDMDPYTAQDFENDITRLSEGRSDPAIVEAVVEGSRDAVEWLARTVRVPFVFSFNRQAYEVNGRQKFWGGMVLGVRNGGKGLMAAHRQALAAKDIEIWFDTPAIRLQASGSSKDGAISGVVVRKDGRDVLLRSSAVILASGGFEASAELRVKHLGKDWANARVSEHVLEHGSVEAIVCIHRCAELRTIPATVMKWRLPLELRIQETGLTTAVTALAGMHMRPQIKVLERSAINIQSPATRWD